MPNDAIEAAREAYKREKADLQGKYIRKVWLIKAEKKFGTKKLSTVFHPLVGGQRRLPSAQPPSDVQQKYSLLYAKVGVQRIPGLYDAIKTRLVPIAISWNDICRQNEYLDHFKPDWRELMLSGHKVLQYLSEEDQMYYMEYDALLEEYNIRAGPFGLYITTLMQIVAEGVPLRMALDMEGRTSFTPATKVPFIFHHDNVCVVADGLGTDPDGFGDALSTAECDVIDKAIDIALEMDTVYVYPPKDGKTTVEDRLWWLVQVLVLNRTTEEILAEHESRFGPQISIDVSYVNSVVRYWAAFLGYPLPARRGKHR